MALSFADLMAQSRARSHAGNSTPARPTPAAQTPVEAVASPASVTPSAVPVAQAPVTTLVAMPVDQAQYDPVTVSVIVSHENPHLSQILVGTTGCIDSSQQFTFDPVYKGISDLYKNFPQTVSMNSEEPEFKTRDIAVSGESAARSLVANLLMASKQSWMEKYRAVMGAQPMRANNSRQGLLMQMAQSEQANTSAAVDAAIARAGVSIFMVPISYESHVEENAIEKIMNNRPATLGVLTLNDLVGIGKVLPLSLLKDPQTYSAVPYRESAQESAEEAPASASSDAQSVITGGPLSTALTIDQLEALHKGCSFEMHIDGHIAVLASSQHEAEEIAGKLAQLHCDMSTILQVVQPQADQATSVIINPYVERQSMSDDGYDGDEDSAEDYPRERLN